jgi:hypothetical protein
MDPGIPFLFQDQNIPHSGADKVIGCRSARKASPDNNDLRRLHDYSRKKKRNPVSVQKQFLDPADQGRGALKQKQDSNRCSSERN